MGAGKTTAVRRCVKAVDCVTAFLYTAALLAQIGASLV
jgi:hypothetical protein